MSISGRTAIVGAAEVDTFQTSGRSPVGLMAVAAKRALDDAGLTVADVDGWAVHPGGPKILDVVQTELGLPPDALAAVPPELR